MEEKNKKKIVFLILGIIVLIIAILIGIFFYALTPVSKKYEEVTFEVVKNEGKEKIVENLKDANLIKSKYVTLLYIILNGNKNIQAGVYEFSRNMSTEDIIKSLNKGEVIEEKRPSSTITFVEGITLKKYLELVSEDTNLDYDIIIKEINDKAYLKGLVADYWFLTDDILDDDIYFPLEGYLFPNTYEFYEETTLDTVVRKMLNETKKQLEPIKEEIEKSKYSVHDILTIASIVEKEANSEEDREKVAQVIYKRLNMNMSLGMDVTTYYGVQKEYKDKNGKDVKLTVKDLNDNNPYNTRVTTFLGLPIGPICNPSITSIKAALNPADTDYTYFYATNGKVLFTNNYSEFENWKKIYG